MQMIFGANSHDAKLAVNIPYIFSNGIGRVASVQNKTSKLQKPSMALLIKSISFKWEIVYISFCCFNQ